MRARPRSNWAWRPPDEPDPGRVVFQRSGIPTRQKNRNRRRARGFPNAPPDEAHWQRTLGRRLRLLLAEN